MITLWEAPSQEQPLVGHPSMSRPRFPILLAGGLAGTHQTGRVREHEEFGDERRKLCSM
jgi:hypothetical protein